MSVFIKLEGIDYDSLMQDVNVESSVVDVCRENVANAVQADPSNVNVSLAAGSVVATVQAPVLVALVEKIRQMFENDFETIEQTITSRLDAIAGLRALSSGSISTSMMEIAYETKEIYFHHPTAAPTAVPSTSANTPAPTTPIGSSSTAAPPLAGSSSATYPTSTSPLPPGAVVTAEPAVSNAPAVPPQAPVPTITPPAAGAVSSTPMPAATPPMPASAPETSSDEQDHGFATKVVIGCIILALIVAALFCCGFL